MFQRFLGRDVRSTATPRGVSSPASLQPRSTAFPTSNVTRPCELLRHFAHQDLQREYARASGLLFFSVQLTYLAAVASLRDGTSMRSRRLVYPASVLMVAGSVCMATGMIISQTRPKQGTSTSANRDVPEDRMCVHTACLPTEKSQGDGQ